ncbi:MAG: ComF family protein [Bacteroidia bacterium]|nr:MAG: ComF family protein [Bacteroidia bacterium]
MNKRLIGLLQQLNDFVSLVYPETCCACKSLLADGERHLCIYCIHGLPKTDFFRYKENQLSRIFWGRMRLETGTSLLYFQKGGKVQRVIHQFKYKGNTDLGFYLGTMLGLSLQHAELYADLDLIVPVPLHPARESKRGFNQSRVISDGISHVLSIPCPGNLLVRREYTSTQTKKSRFRRWENVSAVFDIPDAGVIEGKNILLVDDVVTTGSTLEACGQRLLEIPGTKLWIATLAITA